MAIDWRGALPLTALLLVLAIGKDITLGMGFLGLLVMAVAVLLVLPVLNAAGVNAKTVNPWFVRASALLLVSAVFTVVPSTINTIGWAAVVTDIALGISLLLLLIGSLVALSGVKT